MSDAILLVDREVEVLRSLGGHLEGEGFEVAREMEPGAAVAALERLDPDVVVVDFGLDQAARGRLLEAATANGAPVIAVLASADPAAFRAALEAGAVQVLPRPADAGVLAGMVRGLARATRPRRIAAATALTDGALPPEDRLAQVGSQPPMRQVVQQIETMARSDRAAVLITGEPGVGKAMAARLIHDLGPRAGEPFLICSTVGTPAADLEAALTGLEADAPGAGGRRRRGLLEAAGEGSLRVREVTGLPRELQSTLLRVLEHRQFRRGGGREEVRAGARLIATTSRDLDREVSEGRLMADLQYRLGTQVLAIPPLRERAESDRRRLIERLHAGAGRRWAVTPPPLSEEAMERLLGHIWPGNVTELGEVLERAVLLARGQLAIAVEHLPGELRARPGLGDRRHQVMSLEEVEKRQIESSLRYHGGNRTRAAKELRISRATLINKIKRYGITE